MKQQADSPEIKTEVRWSTSVNLSILATSAMREHLLASACKTLNAGGKESELLIQ